MPLKISSWNVNSVRLRLPQIEQYLQEDGPDVLCFQEIKCLEEQFPAKAFADAGYPYQDIKGQKGMHGVAIISKTPLTAQSLPEICPKGEARAQIVTVCGVELINLYVPAGGDEPDIKTNPKFAHKLGFLDNLSRSFSARKDQNSSKIVLVGDLNIAPGEFDVWSHKQMRRVVSHTEVEIEALRALQDSFGFIDMARICVPESEKLFTWWSYRSKDWTQNNRGRRLDHIWVSKALGPEANSQGNPVFVAHTHCRSWMRPSDHAPISLCLKQP